MAESDHSLNGIMAALRSSDIGDNLPEAVIARIAEIGNILDMDAGDVLTEEGAEGHHAYIILKGTIDVQICTEDPDSPVGTRVLHPGSIIGEMSILETNKRAARSIAGADGATLLCLLDEDLWTLFDSDPAAGYLFMRNLARVLSRRLRVTNLAIRHRFFSEEKSAS